MTESNRGTIANKLVELNVRHSELIYLITGYKVLGIVGGKGANWAK